MDLFILLVFASFLIIPFKRYVIPLITGESNEKKESYTVESGSFGKVKLTKNKFDSDEIADLDSVESYCSDHTGSDGGSE